VSTDPVSLSQSIAGVVAGLQGPSPRGDIASLGTLHNRWSDTVGELVAAHARPVSFDDGRLLIEVDEPAWATEMKFLEADIVARLRSVAGFEVSRFDVRVKRR
jgi:predicted nucleic acid-binding Zn ribbon protein